MKKTSLLILILCLLSSIWVYKYFLNPQSAYQIFDDPKVVALCNAAKNGNTKKIDELIKEGLDVNTQGKNNMNPIFWLFAMNKDTADKKTGFIHLLKHNSDVTFIIDQPRTTLLHTTAAYVDSFYLQSIIDIQPHVNFDLSIPNTFAPTPLIESIVTHRFKNFKILIEAGANINKEEPFNKSPITISSGNGTWHFADYLLKKGVHYNVPLKNKNTIDIVWSLENNRYYITPGKIDYREKVIEFLRSEGVEVNPWYPEDKPTSLQK